MIFRKHGMNPGKSVCWHLNSDKKKRIKLYPGPGNWKMTRFQFVFCIISNIFFEKGKREEKKREQKYLTICTVIRIEHRWLRVARIISHVRNVHAQQIDVWFNVHTRNYAHTNRVNVSINVRQTTYESVGLHTTVIISEPTDFSTRLTIFQIMTIIFLPPLLPLLIPPHHTRNQHGFSISINLHRVRLNLRHPESIFPRHVSQKIFPLVNQKIRRSIKFLSAQTARGSFCWYLQPFFLIHLSVMSISSPANPGTTCLTSCTLTLLLTLRSISR